MIRHILFVQFTKATDAQKIESIKKLFQTIPTKINGINSVEFGQNNSPEHLNKGYTHCVNMEFATEESRDVYLTHPEHEKLKEVFVQTIEDIIVFDYEV